MHSTNQPVIHLYFIAIIPPAPVFTYAQELKTYFADVYNSRAALRSPPHITLHMPFRYKQEKEKKLIHALETLSSDIQPFDVKINGFGAFPPKVIYLDVVREDALVHLQHSVGQMMKQTLNIHNVNYKDQVFHPHLTVAFRDLRKPRFLEAWEEFRSKVYKEVFTAESFSLLKHNGKDWDVFQRFRLKEPNV
ncbi:2'-5' RNA ligase family protein [Fulvivirga sp. M361]|uniref:2'-5' RNA ligase family protein n=1 Tax=Fulvivirga sp. M361 TaxID=2594266 RepID=UPI0016243C1D|nr:2'-5' RNA ligase family protein [Fulvivirga sp. M361]